MPTRKTDLESKMKIQGNMNVLFDDFSMRVSMFKYEKELPTEQRQLFIGESKYGFKIWIYAINTDDGIVFTVTATVPQGALMDVYGMGVQKVNSRSVALISPKGVEKPNACDLGSFGSRVVNALDNSFGIYITPMLFNEEEILKNYFKCK